MRPRRQTMARGNETVANYRGKTKTAEVQKKATKIAIPKTKLTKKSSASSESNGTVVEVRSSTRLRTSKSQSDNAKKEIISSSSVKQNSGKQIFKRSNLTKTGGMTRNPAKRGRKAGSPKVDEMEIPMDVDEEPNQGKPTSARKGVKDETMSDIEEMEEEAKSTSDETPSTSAGSSKEKSSPDSGKKNEKSSTSSKDTKSSEKTEGKSESSTSSSTSKPEGPNAEAGSSATSKDTSEKNVEDSGEKSSQITESEEDSAMKPTSPKTDVPTEVPATAGRSRKRPLPEPSTSVTGQAKRTKFAIERLSRHTRGVGVVLTLGQGDVGQLGLGGDIMERKKPSRVQLPEKIADICAGGMHTVCLSETGKVFTFGCNDEGALGRDTSEEGSECSPEVVDVDGKVVQISAGDSHTAVLTDDGKVYAWGTFRDSTGSMGLLTTSIQTTPQRLLQDIPVAKIASGSDHLAILTVGGRLYTCGCAEQGQLGRVAECFSSRGGRKGIGLLLNPGLAVVRRYRGKELLFDDIWTGSYSTFVRIKDTKDIYVCGLNNYYQLGSEDIKNRFVFERSESFSSKSWLQISGGQHHTLALDENGEVYALGRKEYGRLGLGENAVDTSQPTLVPCLKDINCVDVSCGVATSYAVAENGTVYAWGMGTNFALGTGEEDDQFDPVPITGKQLEAQKTIAVSSGGQHAVLLAVAESEMSQ